MVQDPGWRELVREQLHDHRCAWSSGVFGALAEFERDADEAARQPDPPLEGWITKRGAIAVDLSADAIVHGYETLSARPEFWRHGLVLAQPGSALRQGSRGLIDLGRDAGALRAEDRGDRLFDLGLGQSGIAFCVRSGDPALVAALQAAEGQNILEPGNEAMAAIKRHSPNRVVTSQLGRIEVYQAIPSSTRGDTTPGGPHTHVLPKLLASGRTHDANIALSDGLVPLFQLFPAHPLAENPETGPIFDAQKHEAFQDLLRRFGHPGYTTAKRDAERILHGVGGIGLPEGLDRLERLAWRVALRQAAALGSLSPERLTAWRELLEPASRKTSEAVEGHHS